jgi:hypothetical protein
LLEEGKRRAKKGWEDKFVLYSLLLGVVSRAKEE